MSNDCWFVQIQVRGGNLIAFGALVVFKCRA